MQDNFTLSLKTISKREFKGIRKLYVSIFGLPSPGMTVRWKTFSRFFNEFIERDKIKRVWDAGCGSGEYSIAIAEFLSESYVIGDDFQDEAIKKANSLKITSNIKFMRTNILKSNHENIDLVLSITVLEHLIEDEFHLQQIYNSLNPNGMLYLRVPLLLENHNYHQHDHVRDGYKSDEILKMLMNVGFEVKKTYFEGSLTSNMTQMIWREENPNTVLKYLRYLIFPLTKLLFTIDSYLINGETQNKYSYSITILATKPNKIIG